MRAGLHITEGAARGKAVRLLSVGMSESFVQVLHHGTLYDATVGEGQVVSNATHT